jgi:hypothetical protein
MDNPYFVKLTTVEGGPVWINLGAVWRILRIENGGSMLYIMTGGYMHTVKETPEEIIDKLNEDWEDMK